MNTDMNLLDDRIQRLAAGSCPLAPTDVFTAPNPTIILSIDVSNPTVGSQTVTVKLGGTILFTTSMPASGGASWNGPQTIGRNQTVNVVASSTSCTFTVSGVEIG